MAKAKPTKRKQTQSTAQSKPAVDGKLEVLFQEPNNEQEKVYVKVSNNGSKLDVNFRGRQYSIVCNSNGTCSGSWS